ncbi:MAG: hypothetical protein ACK52J_02100 [bacterium]
MCTGHTNPHCSGNSLRTVVVFISVKYAPLCIFFINLHYGNDLKISCCLICQL